MKKEKINLLGDLGNTGEERKQYTTDYLEYM